MTQPLFLQIEGKSLSCSCGHTHHIHTQKTLVGNNLLPRLPQLLREIAPANKVLLIFDENTYRAAGSTVEQILKREQFEVIPVLLRKNPGLFYLEPDEEARAQIGEYLYQNPDILMAVGSGVINDLVKFVAHRVSLPFLSVATAPSMDGYPSPGAPMMVSGYKVTYQATPPRAILADLDVLTQAPMPLIHAGLLDLLGKVIANADWIMRKTLWEEDFCDAIWQMTRENLQSVVAEAENLSLRKPEAIYALTVALLNSGFGMDMIGDSRPASGAEHLIAHYLEIMALHRSIDPSLHGLRVGTATVLMHRIYRRFLEEMSDLPWDRKTSSGEKLETVKTAFGPLFPLVQETVRKKLDMVVPPIIKERQVQKQLKEAVAEKLSVLTNPLEVLKKAQAPEHLVSLGFPKTMIREAFLFARFLRERATILDLLDQIGLLEEYVDWVLKENQGTR